MWANNKTLQGDAMLATISWILFIGIIMLCLAGAAFTPQHDKDGHLAKLCAIVIVGLAVIFGLVSL